MNPKTPSVRAASVVGVALGAALLTSRVARAADAKLLVFLHVALKQRAFQAELQAALRGIGVTAVGRGADFERALADGQDGVLTLPVVLAAQGLTPKLRGLRQGSSDEKYSLVAVDRAPNPASVAAVGALDLLGREGTTKFVHELVGSQPKVERVTKVEDLLPLLQMTRVDAVLLPSRLLADLRALSRLNLVQRELATPVGLPALASVGPSGAQVLGAVSQLPSNICNVLGVDAWR